MRLISHLEIKIQLVPGKISIKDWSFNFIEKLIFGITAMALWVKTFQSNRKVPGSNFTRHLAGLGDTTSLRGKQWPLGWNSTVARDWPWDWPWGSQVIDKKNSVFTIHDNTSSDVKSFIIRGFTKKNKLYWHIVRLTIWHHLFLEFWLVNTWFFAHWRHQRAVTRLENVRQLNIRRDKKLGFQLSHRQPLTPKPHVLLKSIKKFNLYFYKFFVWN